MNQIIPRDEWADLGPNRPMSRTNTGSNIDGTVIHWPGPYYPAQGTYLQELQSYNRYHQNGQGWSFLGYNFAVDPDGKIYEGRGFDHKNAANLGANGTTYSILFLRTGLKDGGTEVAPTSAALFAAGQLVAVHPGNGDIRPHSDFGTSGTECPGSLLTAQIPTIKQVAGQPPVPPLPGPDPIKDDEMIANLYAAYMIGGRRPRHTEIKAWVEHIQETGKDLTEVCLWIAEKVADGG